MQRERFKQALRNLTRDPRVDYQALFPATVLNDHGDMTLDLRPDHPRLPELTRVPLRIGLPGAVVELKPQARVLLAFEEGDPASPIALLWLQGSVKRLKVDTVERLEISNSKGASVVLEDTSVTVSAVEVTVTASSVKLGGAAATFPVAIYGPAGLQPSAILKGLM